MKNRALGVLSFAFAVVLFSAGQSSGQVVEVVKDVAEKTAEITVDAAKTTASGAKTFGGNVVEVTENIAEKTVKGGRYLTVKTWDGTKWVAKKVWFASKKAADATKDFVVGDDKPQDQ